MRSCHSLLFLPIVILSFFLLAPQGASAHFVGYAAIQTRLVAQDNIVSLHTEVDKNSPSQASTKPLALHILAIIFQAISLSRTKTTLVHLRSPV
jgi:hypothetical protein